MNTSNHLRRRPLLLFSLLVSLGAALGACDESTTSDAGNGSDAAMSDSGTFDSGRRDSGTTDSAVGDSGPVDDAAGSDAGPISCPRVLAAADRDRFVVISRPYEGLTETDRWEVLGLDQSGVLTRPGTVFTMGRGDGFSNIEFTPDGEVGIAVQDDGTLGVFRLDASGTPTVVHAAYDGGFYADSVVINPAGDAVWVLDAEWREVGGGIYRVPIACDGTLGTTTLVAAARLPYGMQLLADGRAVLASKDVLGVALGPDAHIVDLATPAVAASGDVFAHDDWIGAGFTVTANEQHVIMGDNSIFAPVPNGIGVASLGASSVTPLQTIAIDDPVAIVASPFDDAVLVVSGLPEGLTRFAYDPSSSTPLSGESTITTTGASPALPYGTVLLVRGSLRGLVLIAENVAVRQMRFDGGGEITDLGPFTLGDPVGAIGIQP